MVRRLIYKGADLTFAGRYGWTPLHAASSSGKIEVVKVLLEHNKFLVTAQDSCGRTTLFLAAHEGHHEVVGELCAIGYPGTTDYYGSTPLFAATRNGHVKTVELLLSLTNPRLESKDVFGETLISWARWSGSP